MVHKLSGETQTAWIYLIESRQVRFKANVMYSTGRSSIFQGVAKAVCKYISIFVIYMF